MENKEIKALIALLDDPDLNVFQAVSNRIIGQGPVIVPLLEKAWESSLDELMQTRIESLIHSIQLNNVEENLAAWVNQGAVNLLDGAFLVAKYQYPELSLSAIDRSIEAIKKDIWIELNDNLTALEKVKILNHVIFEVHGFAANLSNFYSPQNSFINQVLETKKGGQISLAIVYSIIGQKLGLPIFGVDLPKNFILCYKDRYKASAPNADPRDEILFYINPFNKGTALSRREIEYFLTQQNIEQKKEHFLPCSNQETISQLIVGLILAYERLGYKDKIEDLRKLYWVVKEKKV